MVQRSKQLVGNTAKTGRGQNRAVASNGRPSRGRRSFAFPPTVSKPDLLDADGKDRSFRQFLYDFSVLGSHLEMARAYLASQLNLSSPQYNIVMIIAQYQGDVGVSVSDVAQHLHVTTAFITSEVGKLDQAGLIEKRPNPNDGRSVLLQLSSLGEEAVLQIGPKRLFVNDHLFRRLSGQDFRHLAQAVASLIDDFSETIDMLTIMRRDPQRGSPRSVGQLR